MHTEYGHSVSFIVQDFRTYPDYLHPDIESIGGGPVPSGLPYEVRNTWEHWKLIPNGPPTLQLPAQKRVTAEIQGANGILDLTYENVKYPLFGNREGTIEFLIDFDGTPAPICASIISKFLHGRPAFMVLEDDPEYYYIGTFSINGFNPGTGGERSSISIGYSVYPYKISLYNSLDEWLWDPFNFYTDRINHASDFIISNASVNIYYRNQNNKSAAFNYYKNTLNMFNSGATYDSSRPELQFMNYLNKDTLTSMKTPAASSLTTYNAWAPLIDLYDYCGTMPTCPIIYWKPDSNASTANEKRLIVNYVHNALGINYCESNNKAKELKVSGSSNLSSQNVEYLGLEDGYYKFRDNDIILSDMMTHQDNYIQFLGVGEVKLLFRRGAL